MIYKGIVEEIIDPFSIKVRIPLLHRLKSSPQGINDTSLPIASICTLSKCHPNLCKGDIVIIGFDNDDLSKPIILGHLYKESFDSNSESIELTDLKVTSNTQLSSNTSIGDITSEELKQLIGVRDNLQKQLDLLLVRIEKLESNK